MSIARNSDDISTNFRFIGLFHYKYDDEIAFEQNIRCKIHMLIAMYVVYTKIFSFVKYSSEFCTADISKIQKSHFFMESTIKFPVYGSYKFELFLKCKLSSYISRTKYYMLQSIESHSIYYEQVFICLQQSNFCIYIWFNFDENNWIHDHLFDFILVEWFVDKRSTISTPSFVWSF